MSSINAEAMIVPRLHVADILRCVATHFWFSAVLVSRVL